MASVAPLDDRTEQLIADLIADGRFGRRVDVLRYGVELVYAEGEASFDDLDAATRAAIEQGIADCEAGRTRPAGDVFRELRAEFGVDR